MGFGSGYGAGRGTGKFSGKKCRLVSMFALTSAFFVVEIVTGYVTNSMALVADSFHMLSDIAALVIAFISVRMAPKSWSKNTFGWARAEVLGALVNAVFLVALCFSITVESLKRFYEPEDIHNPVMILYVGAMGLAVNLIGLLLFAEHGSSHGHSHGLSRSTHSHLTDLADRQEKDGVEGQIIYPGEPEPAPPKPKAHSHSHHGHSHGGANMNMRGVFLHVMADALGSVVVIISAVIMWKTEWEYKLYVDPGLSLLLVILILRSVWPLLIDSALILLQTVPTHIQVDSLQRKLMEQVDGILAVHEFHVWQLTGDRIIASAHIRCLNLAQYMEVAEKVKEFFHHEGIHSTTIQPEFVEMLPHETGVITSTQDCVLSCPKPVSTIAAGCDASKCCPDTKKGSNDKIASVKSRSRQSSPSAKNRRPSSVSIAKETSSGLKSLGETIASRRSAPNLSLNEPSPENTVEMTAELNLSDSAPSSNNSSFRQDASVPLVSGNNSSARTSTPAKPFTPSHPIHPVNQSSSTAFSTPTTAASPAAFAHQSPAGFGTPVSSFLNETSSKSINRRSHSSSRGTTPRSSRHSTEEREYRSSGSSDHQEGESAEEHTPMVPRTKSRVVRVISKQSNV